MRCHGMGTGQGGTGQESRIKGSTVLSFRLEMYQCDISIFY